MTVKELIENLKRLDETSKVCLYIETKLDPEDSGSPVSGEIESIEFRQGRVTLKAMDSLAEWE